MAMRPRVCVTALILHEHRLVTIAKRDELGEYYSFPGGGQRTGETLIQAVEREVHEETGWHVTVGNLVVVREYIGRNHEFATEDKKVHIVVHLFSCALADPASPPDPVAPDHEQVGVVWLAIEQ